jgi:hypothetical protein
MLLLRLICHGCCRGHVEGCDRGCYRYYCRRRCCCHYFRCCCDCCCCCCGGGSGGGGGGNGDGWATAVGGPPPAAAAPGRPPWGSSQPPPQPPSSRDEYAYTLTGPTRVGGTPPAAAGPTAAAATGTAVAGQPSLLRGCTLPSVAPRCARERCRGSQSGHHPPVAALCAARPPPLLPLAPAPLLPLVPPQLLPGRSQGGASSILTSGRERAPPRLPKIADDTLAAARKSIMLASAPLDCTGSARPASPCSAADSGSTPAAVGAPAGDVWRGEMGREANALIEGGVIGTEARRTATEVLEEAVRAGPTAAGARGPPPAG